jgi:hypothetical protein
VTAAELLADLVRQGFRRALRGSGLAVAPAGRLTDAQRQAIGEHKAELLTLLGAGAGPAAEGDEEKAAPPRAIAAAPTRARESLPRPEPSIPNDSAPEMLTGRQPGRVKTVFLPDRQVVSLVRSYRASAPKDVQVVGCVVDQARGGVVFTIKSDTFPVVGMGEPVPELAPEFAR